MSFGKIYTYTGNPRTSALLTIAKINGLDVEVIQTKTGKDATPEYIAEHHPLGKVPAFEGKDGLKLFETLAIASYFAKQDPNTTLIPKDTVSYAKVVQWCSFANHEILPALGNWFRPTLGREHYNKKNVDAAEVHIKSILKYVDSYLQDVTYVVGERLTLADLVLTAHLDRGFQYLFDGEYFKEFPNVVRYWTLIRNFKPYHDVMGEPKLLEKRIQYTAPKKEAPPKKETQQKPKEEPKPKAPAPKDEEEEEDDTPKEKAPKHPLGALANPTIPIDEWKRQYSNNDTDVALKWFWGQYYNPKEYSLWRVDYKYPEELGLTFQTSNLITGFFNRLEASRKYLFGCLLVLGENNNGAISGAFLVRGDEYLPAFEVAPDWESYDFKKLDPTSEKDKEFIRDAWTWDKPIDGKPVADGKVFK